MSIAQSTTKRCAIRFNANNTSWLRLLAALLLLLGGCSRSDSTQDASRFDNGADGTEEEFSGELLDGVRVVHVRALMFDWVPNPIILKAGEPVKLIVNSVDAVHGIVIPDLGINKRLPPGQPVEIELSLPDAGTYDFFCSVVCGWGHNSMTGYLLVLGDEDSEGGGLGFDLPQPKDSAFPTRHLVKAYRYEDLQPHMDWPKGSRSFAVGKKLFVEMTCSKCHRIEGSDDRVGPSLAREDLKFTRHQLLREIVEPSRNIDAKYRQWAFLAGGKVILGTVVEDNDEYYLVDENPGETQMSLQVEPTKIMKEDLDELPQPSDLSTMPSRLLNAMTVEEIQNLIAYVHAKGNAQHQWFEEPPLPSKPQ
ncbi:MAG: c-type cytochrome [Planctomycetes bacterium]|nr:c-type cytochrome [Planctomycetota bacterium]